jgi:hypothetical protein
MSFVVSINRPADRSHCQMLRKEGKRSPSFASYQEDPIQDKTMRNRTTFAEIDELASQLPSPEQLTLAARICERLSAAGRTEKERRREHLAWLRECDRLAKEIAGTFDSARDLREIRHGRA